MASKMISIKESLYLKLKRMKKPTQSFSDLIEELIKNVDKDPLKHFGIGKDMDSKIMDELEEIIDNDKENEEDGLPQWIEEWLM